MLAGKSRGNCGTLLRFYPRSSTPRKAIRNVQHPFFTEAPALWKRLESLLRFNYHAEAREQAIALFDQLSSKYAEVIDDLKNWSFGRGFHAGYRAGYDEGWQQRDAQARRALAAETTRSRHSSPPTVGRMEQQQSDQALAPTAEELGSDEIEEMLQKQHPDGTIVKH